LYSFLSTGFDIPNQFFEISSPHWLVRLQNRLRKTSTMPLNKDGSVHDDWRQPQAELGECDFARPCGTLDGDLPVIRDDQKVDVAGLRLDALHNTAEDAHGSYSLVLEERLDGRDKRIQRVLFRFDHGFDDRLQHVALVVQDHLLSLSDGQQPHHSPPLQAFDQQRDLRVGQARGTGQLPYGEDFAPVADQRLQYPDAGLAAQNLVYVVMQRHKQRSSCW